MAQTVQIQILKTNSPAESIVIKTALEKLANNFSKENLVYLAELCEKPGANEKFMKLKNNPLVRSLL